MYFFFIDTHKKGLAEAFLMNLSASLLVPSVLSCTGSYDDDAFRFNDASTHEGHLRQNGELTWFCNETVIMMSYMHKMNGSYVFME